ncbi:hypothetical protein D2T31_17490 [Sinirhodobacter populi]|uniref:Uncharacterized protein n=1 Tax=Paenirhodobacter populi TaxID=2306993 RepID=A0A443K3C8_9RHOB|nr:hypothetical protein [Sinirhodobacter populi]RWR27256.1 hypothetical protein D2T31_17490 [Sinirhodobacter populi]
MAVPLDQWQERMERHFATLAERRSTSGFPLFALEHGLDDGELEQISKQLRARLNTGLRLASHWLLWTIYAAERGYTYGGGEYWQSFEDATPGWDSRHRYRVTAWFSKFHSTYNGVVPSGPWASHFSIIAWPITHAVLPRYLQQQFVRTLYDLRFTLARLTTIEPAVIGRLIANNVYHASTRFDQFLQQEELVGRIVLALLHQNPREGEEPLLPATLNRIVVDLEQIRYARGWLRETSRVVADRFKGIGRGAALSSPGENLVSVVERRLRETRPDIRPDLRLRYASGGRWTLVIDVPNFKGIAALNPDIQQFLRQTRSKLNGDDVKRPAGWVLSGNRRAALKAWPDPSRPLVSFESPNGVVDHLLESECRMSRGPTWLFRIGDDGIAREISSRLMRPGYDYILASADEFEDLQEGMTVCAIECCGICAIRVSVPSEVSGTYMQWLRMRKLELARTIRVWPAGLPGRNWDGEGRSEWLTTEKPCFGIVPDHPVDSYLVTLDGDAVTSFPAKEPGKPTFIQLPRLAAGTHRLSVRARRSAALDELGASPSHEGYLELRVREPEPWIPGTTSHVGLVVTSNPHDAALDVFWENELDLTVFGPEGRKVIPHVRLEDAKGEEIYSAQVCSPLDLPILPETWHKRFQEFLRQEHAEWRYLEAASGLLTIEGQELGRFVVRFDHDALPVRWVLRHRGEGVELRLVDDTAQEDAEPKCRFFSMEAPTKIERLDTRTALAGFDVQSPGGLFIVQNGKFRDLVIVSTGLSGTGLEGLGVHPVFARITDSPKSIIKHMRILRYWKSARLAGFLSNARRGQIVVGLTTRLYGALAGRDWGRAEAAFMRSNDWKKSFDHLQSLLDHRSGFPAVLRRDALSIDGRRSAIVGWYAELAARYGVCSDKALCTLAVDIASRPHEVPRLYGERLPGLLKHIMAKPLLLRGARIVALSHACSDDRPVELVPRWE